jgi:putative DNA primase/helicase
MSAGTHHANGKHVGGANEKPAKPVALAVIHDNIPAELRAKNQWVMWRYECRDDRWTKPPSCAHTGRPASSTDPSSWSTFEVAYAAYRSGDWDGIGFVHLPEDNLTGGDWDGVRNPNTGEIDPDVAAEITRWDTYTEVSPSGTGIRAYARGMKPGARSKQGDFEIYSGLTAEGKPGGRFLTVTGHRLPSSPIAINERQAQIDQSYRERWPDAKPKPNGTQKTNQAGTGNLDDDELLRRAKSAKNGDKFSRLMAGEIGMYGNDESRADLALCGELAFWFGPDPARIDRIFRTSGLMREKWDSRRGEGTYGQRTIAKALSERTEFYSSTRAAPIKPQTQAGSDSEPKGALVNEIQIGPDEHRVISQVTAVIRYDDGLYQRGGKLPPAAPPKARAA